MRTKTADTDDDPPNTTAPPAGEIVTIDKGRGYRASLDMAATGKVATVTVWVKNETTGKWDSVGTIVGVTEHVQFGDPGFNSDLPSGRIWFQFTTITSGAAPFSAHVQAV